MTKTISPLRQRMIEDMRLRNFTEGTQKTYVRAVANYSLYHGRSPDHLDYDDVRSYQLHLAARGLKASSISQIMCALRFFYGTTLSMKDASEQIPLPRVDDSLPAILSRSQVSRFLAHAPNLKMRALFATIYAAGLRVSEATGLMVGDIDSNRMTILVRMAKRRRDRHVMLSPKLLMMLMQYWCQARPSHWLFPGSDGMKPITTRSVQRACRLIVRKADLDRSVKVHTLRHSFATHLLEQGVDIRVIQGLLGHRSIVSTTRYARVDLNAIRQVQSPLAHLDLSESPWPDPASCLAQDGTWGMCSAASGLHGAPSRRII